MGQRMSHRDLMKKIRSVPAVAENRKSMHFKLGIAILKKRLELNLTQEELVERVKANGGTITQATISKMESAETDVKLSTFEKVLEALEATVEVVDNTTSATLEVEVTPGNGKKESVRSLIKSAINAGKEVMPYSLSSEVLRHMFEEMHQSSTSEKVTSGSLKSYKGNYEKELKELEMSR